MPPAWTASPKESDSTDTLAAPDDNDAFLVYYKRGVFKNLSSTRET
jgi:hypothetical protein